MTLLPFPIKMDALETALIQANVAWMSDCLLGIPYVTLKTVIYPSPRYRCYGIRKKNGDVRLIAEPHRQLKEIQHKVLAYLVEHGGSPKPCAHAFISKRSIVTNAKEHCSPRTLHILNIDIENFFPSITFYRVRGVFQNKPFNFSYEVATVLAQICCYNGTLPQGAPTSPTLANLVCRSLDKDLMGLAKRHRATYTRYCDDITFSFSTRDSKRLPSNICSFDGGLVTLGEELCSILSSHSFKANDSKTRLSSSRHRLEVTGLTINEFPNVKRRFVDEIRGALHAWEKHGYAAASAAWEARPYRRSTRTGRHPPLHNVIAGKLLFLKMVRGPEDLLYTRLAERYNQLGNDLLKEEFTRLPVSRIVRNSDEVEQGVFVVEWTANVPGKDMICGQGTAFALRAGLITCDHVLRSPDGKLYSEFPDAELTLINPSTRASWPARVLRHDPDYDLAVLAFDTVTSPDHRHFAISESQTDRNLRGFLVGFPNHSPGRRANQLAASVTIPFTRSGLNRLEISTTIRKGNSGGPFLDERFQVVGIAQQGATQDEGNDECLCIREVVRWVATVTTTPPPTAPAPAASGEDPATE